MASVASVSSRTAAALTAPDNDVASRVPQKALGQNDFLQLLATQFKTQDPMNPMQDTAFIAQMAQFSALEQASTMSREMSALRADQLRVTANSYLGHRVTVTSDDGTPVTGDVSAIDASGDEPLLVVGDVTYPLSAVLRVEPRVVTVPPPAGAGPK